MVGSESTEYTCLTPSETTAADKLDHLDPLENDNSKPSPPSSSVPWPDSTYIIRSAATGNVVTLEEGKIVLQRPGGLGSIHWVCVETKGWLGFRSPVSGRFLGHDKEDKLTCFAERHLDWEMFCVRAVPSGGFVMLKRHYDQLWYVGNVGENGEEKAAKIIRGRDDAIVWEFVKL